jgi:hypothetical protein
MNERIEKLIEQCTVQEFSDCTGGFETFDKAKFAELIVKECVGILMKPEYAMNHPEELTDYNRGWANGRLLGIEHIKEHFGVKE